MMRKVLLVVVLLTILVISAQAQIGVPINILAGGWCPCKFCDANCDGRVDALDASILATSYGKCMGQAGYDRRADFNCDGCVNALDAEHLKIEYWR